MLELPENLKEVITFLSRLSGVGEKTALRYSLSIANWKESDLHHFSEQLSSLSDLQKCMECGFFSDTKVCSYCMEEGRQRTNSICIVSNIPDYIAIEKSSSYKGLYHILGGVLDPLKGIGPDELRISSLVKRIERLKISKILIALNSTLEGDITSTYLREIIPASVEVNRIGFGIPMGGSIEYLDPMTISKGLENSKTL